MTELTEHPHIFRVIDDKYHEDGFYFKDETEMTHGPYPDYTTTRDEFDRYCREYL